MLGFLDFKVKGLSVLHSSEFAALDWRKKENKGMYAGESPSIKDLLNIANANKFLVC
jgi:hypothetical protein